MRPFDYTAPASVQEAVAALAENGRAAKPLAGGTDLLVRIKRDVLAPRLLVDLAGIGELYGIQRIDQGLRIGAMTTHSEIAASPLVREQAPAVAAASAAVGSVQTRNLGTLGGNLVSCVPSIDGGPALLALDAVVTIANPDRRWQMPLEELLFEPHCSALTPDELLVDVIIPAESLGRSSAFVKYRRRKGLSLALVNVAAAVDLDVDGDRIQRVAIGLGAVAPTTIRARQAEAYLTGQPVRAGMLAEAAKIAASETSPIDDFRASAHYRRELVKVLTRRVLEEAIARARLDREVSDAL